jgi:hypothetical protein
LYRTDDFKSCTSKKSIRLWLPGERLSGDAPDMIALPLISGFRTRLDRPSGRCAERSATRLAKRQTLGRVLAAGQSVQCLRGRLWLTAEARDIVLREGERFTATTPTRLLIEALEDSVVGG